MKLICAALIAFGLAILCGCSGVQFKPVSIPVLTPTQLANQFCPLVKADLDILAASPLVVQPLKDKITALKPFNDAACNAGAVIDLTDIQAFNTTVFATVTAVVAAVPALPNQPVILLGLQLAQPLVDQLVADATAQAKAAIPTVPADPPVPASAPVAVAPSA